MPIEQFDGGLSITGEHIQVHRLLSLAIGLALEVNTGLSNSRGSAMLAANSVTSRLDTVALSESSGVKVKPLGAKRTKRGALEDLVLFLMLAYTWEMSDSVRRALGEDRAAKVERLATRITDGQLKKMAEGS